MATFGEAFVIGKPDMETLFLQPKTGAAPEGESSLGNQGLLENHCRDLQFFVRVRIEITKITDQRLWNNAAVLKEQYHYLKLSFLVTGLPLVWSEKLNRNRNLISAIEYTSPRGEFQRNLLTACLCRKPAGAVQIRFFRRYRRG